MLRGVRKLNLIPVTFGIEKTSSMCRGFATSGNSMRGETALRGGSARHRYERSARADEPFAPGAKLPGGLAPRLTFRPNGHSYKMCFRDAEPAARADAALRVETALNSNSGTWRSAGTWESSSTLPKAWRTHPRRSNRRGSLFAGGSYQSRDARTPSHNRIRASILRRAALKTSNRRCGSFAVAAARIAFAAGPCCSPSTSMWRFR